MQGGRYRRYAIYWTPAPGPLARFGAGWLGWDPAAGQSIQRAGMPGISQDRLAVLTEGPDRYGLHATLKAPFCLAPGASESDARAALEAFAARTAPVQADGLALARMGRFLCLQLDGDERAVSALAADAVHALDPLRAPLTEAEMARRGRMTPEAEALIRRWGYPHVMERYRFHVTLTARLEDSAREEVRAALAPFLAPLLPRPFRIDALSLMGEDRAGRFHLLGRVPLTGAA
ncbi:Protein of unknown function [Roseovarius nanhaiticus]|uniref:Phosphonate metabolism protein n=1 Tax=Roseovarius nanhaiticus TaxID=573024 RepID=A0A1N7H3V4_9RHOB|nr:DUF1045 domain-containing protein [Roseovarius nanhaiticus]SEL14174.1 Protein of unknown function [Roseovarius nanhaiticus]SIS19501.1 Protein of unknown function [Roseovarius nanhaiticus]